MRGANLCCNHPTLHVYKDDWYWSAYCDNCYDGAPDSTNRNDVGTGDSAKEALDNWLEIVSPE